jgi:type I restriction enzyme, S subunit
MNVASLKTVEITLSNKRIGPTRALRNSRIHWLGNVPNNWSQKRLKFAVQLVKDKAEAAGSELPYVGMENIQSATGRLIAGSAENAADGLSNSFHPDDVLFGKLRPYLAKVLHANTDGLCSSELLVMRPRDVLPRFLLYYCLSTEFIRVVDSSTYGSKMPRASWQFIGNLPILVPPLDERRAIAAFLDRETTKIDKLIEKKIRLCELLDERLHSLICRVVVSGLDANVDARQSRIPWLQSYPAHWRVVALSWFSRVSNGSTPSQGKPEYWQDGDVPWVSSGEVNQYRITAPTALITQVALRDCSVRIIRRGAVLIGMVGQGRTRGMTSILDIDACINQNVAAIEPCADLDSEFLQFALMQAYEPIRQYGRGGRQEALNCRLVGAIRIALPPLTEQLEIASYIKTQRERILSLKEQLHQHNSRLREYRSALISAAVTGQIDVRNHRTEVPQ